MIKKFTIGALVMMSGTAFAENQSPWFGGDASPPQQIATTISASEQEVSAKNVDCAIYNCTTLVNIAKPEQKSASNP